MPEQMEQFPGIIAGLVLLCTMKELPATLLLRPTNVETLSTRIWNAAEDGFLSEMSATSLVHETEEGRVALPGRVYHEEPITLILKAEGR